MIAPWSATPAPEPTAHIAIMPGALYCSAEPALLTTVLGSCVAVCLWDGVRGFGGMNHFVLPSDPQAQDNPRYGDVAMVLLTKGLLRLGSRVRNLQAKVFGGAAVLSFGGKTIGSGNVEFALDWLQRRRIPITAQRTGGDFGQQVRFHTGNGEVLVRYIPAGGSGDAAPRGRRA